MNRIYDVLTGYYICDENIKRLAKGLHLCIDDIAQLKAYVMQDTEEGRLIYENAIV